MAKAPKRIFIKPKMVDVGRGPQLATIPYPTVVGGRRKLLKSEGDTVSMDGASGSYWTRRINEGSVEEVDPRRAASVKTEEPKQPAEHGKKDGKH